MCIKKLSKVPQQFYKRDYSVEIEIGMYISGKLLMKDKKKTTSRLLKEETVWDESVQFDFDMHNIPKVCKGHSFCHHTYDNSSSRLPG